MTSMVDELVLRLRTFNPRPVWLHGYVAPFLVLYSVNFYFWFFVSGYSDGFEAGCICTAVVGIAQVLTCLFCYWFVHVRCLLTCSRSEEPLTSQLIEVTPTVNNGWPELVRLQKSKDHLGGEILHFTFQRLKYVFDRQQRWFAAVSYPVDASFSHYQNHKGLEDDQNVLEALARYGDNRMDMDIPEFLQLFTERATAPFFVFQVFCVLLWCLDEYWYYSLFTLFMLVVFEATLVKQQLKNMSEIRNMGNKPFPVQVYRTKKWRPMLSIDLLPGDIISIGRAVDDRPVPCDLLLVRGPCIVDESMLTGESIPQMKEPIEDTDSSTVLDIEAHGKLHVLFGGTKVVQHSPPPKLGPGLKAPDNGCICYVLRTGFNTSQGKLLRTILFAVKRVTANTLETFCFILFLLMFAIAAASYVWIKGSEDESRNKYKLFLECTLILTSVVPPELPIELSLAVNNSLVALTKLGVYCTEPFRIPFAGKVSICAFDKTGTLTTDNLIVEGVAGLNHEQKLCPLADAPFESIQVIATCHSLIQLEDELIGDPLEKACLNSIDWVLTKNDSVIPKKGKQTPLKIFSRNHFSSALKRMSVIAGYLPPGSSEPVHLAAVKGAPEILKAMFRNPPANYDTVYREMTQQGARVLALGFRPLGPLSHQQIRETTRAQLETDLEFAGFIIISCPLKPDSKQIIKEIQQSSHQVTMITGDNALTACHVAKVLRFTRKEVTLILDTLSTEITSDNDKWAWRSVDEAVVLDVIPAQPVKSFIADYDLCLTGPALAYLKDTHPQFLLRILPYVRVFARVAPKQKEFVITSLKALGYVTLMCGDGTNDVGALKHADVGVALLSHPVSAALNAKAEERAAAKLPTPTTSAAVPSNALANRRPNAVVVGGQRIASSRSSRASAENGATAASSQHQKRLDKINQMMKQLEEEEKATVVKLGDASIAAPFTSRWSSIQCICHVIKQGRCTLVTTLQMFKILALNALVLAYSQSVLYLDGIKFSDSQATAQGLLLAACFLFISRSKPLTVLSKQRPLTNIFNFYTLLTVTSQFAVHFCCLFYLVREAHALSPPRDGKVNLEEKFQPSLLNSTVYVMSVALQLSTFAVNYRGHPFMESLWENKALLYSLLISGGAIVSLAAGVSPEATQQFELVLFPDAFRNTILLVLVCDLTLCFVVDRILAFLIGDVRVKAVKF